MRTSCGARRPATPTPLGEAADEHHGGACTIDLATGTLANLIDPSTHRYNIADVSPHPTTTDRVAVAGQLDASAWFECMELNYAGTASVGCPDVPEPLILDWTGASWVGGGVHVDLPPSLVGTTITFGAVDPNLYFGTEGAGAWRTYLTW